MDSRDSATRSPSYSKPGMQPPYQVDTTFSGPTTGVPVTVEGVAPAGHIPFIPPENLTNKQIATSRAASGGRAFATSTNDWYKSNPITIQAVPCVTPLVASSNSLVPASRQTAGRTFFSPRDESRL